MNNIYFASDFHFGSPDFEESRKREEKVVRWLDTIKENAQAIYLMGDLFDFWHEYKTVVPKGYTRFLGKLAELSDAGIDIQVFTGNHDLWMYGYFEKELGIKVFKEPEVRNYNGKSFFIGHGDGLGPEKGTVKILRKIFHNPFLQWAFRWLHPDIGMKLANLWSKQSRGQHKEPERYLGEENEYLVLFAKEKLQQINYDFFIFGHRHLPLDIKLNEKGSRYINLGEWFSQCNYAVFNGEKLTLQQFKD